MKFPTSHQQSPVQTPKIIDRYHSSPSGAGSYYGPPGSSYFPPLQSQAPDQDGFANKNHYSGWSGGGGSGKGNAAVSALTLLAFLFFLNVLQQCISDQMAAMNPQVMIMTAGRVAEDQLTFKSRNFDQETKSHHKVQIAGNTSVKHSARAPTKDRADGDKCGPANSESCDDEGFAGYVSAMTDDEV